MVGSVGSVGSSGSGTGVAFAPTSCGVALAPTQGGGRGEHDPRVGADVTPPRFAWQGRQGAMVSESRKDRFAAVTVSYDVFFKCHVVTSISSNFQDALGAML